MNFNIVRRLRRAYHLLPPLVCALITLIVAYQFAQIEPDFHHDGIVLQSGVDLHEGRIPFRDSYQQYGLGEPLLALIAVSFFGKNILAVRTLTVVFYTIIAFMLWIVWRKLIPAWLTAITFLIWLFMSPYLIGVFLPWPSVHAILFQVLSIWCLIRFIEEGLTKYLFWGGLFCGGAWLCKWTVGIPLFASIGFFLIINRIGGPSHNGSPTHSTAVWKQLALVSFGFLAVLGPSFLFLVLTSSVKDFFLQTMSSHIQCFGIADSPWRCMMLRLPYYIFFLCGTPWCFISLICLLMFMWGLYQSFTKSYQLSYKDKISFLLATTGMASLLQIYPQYDFQHAFWASTPVFGLLSYAVWRQFLHTRWDISIGATLAVLFLFFGYSTLMQVQKARTRLMEFNTYINEPGAVRGMKTTERDAAELQKLWHKMKSLEMMNPDKKVLVLHPDAVWNLLPQKPLRFHKLFVRWEVLEKLYPDYQKILDEVIRIEEPILLVARDLPVGYGPPKGDYLPEGYAEVFKTQFGDRPEVVLALPKK